MKTWRAVSGSMASMTRLYGAERLETQVMIERLSWRMFAQDNDERMLNAQYQ